MLLGDGSPDPASLVLPVETLGIRGDFNQAATPRALVAYRAGLTYFHGGLSLEEALMPVISIRIRVLEKKGEILGEGAGAAYPGGAGQSNRTGNGLCGIIIGGNSEIPINGNMLEPGNRARSLR